MSAPTIVRCLASVGLLGTFGVVGYFFMVVGIRQTYFPDESNAHLVAIILGFSLLAAYFIGCIRYARFLWIMPAVPAARGRKER